MGELNARMRLWYCRSLELGLKTSGLGLKIRKLRTEEERENSPMSSALSPMSSAQCLQPDVFKAQFKPD